MPAIWKVRALAAALASTGLISVAAAADTLPDALAAAYASNPDIAAERAVVRQADEGVPQALAFGRPGVNVTASEQQNGSGGFIDAGRVFQSQLAITQSLYRGGRTRVAVSAAENRILAARARLRATENTILVNVVTAYSDVLRYAELVNLNANQVKVLERELQASRDRFEVGDLTRTDVAQSDARLANARSQLQVAQGQLATARNAYMRVVGRPAEDLQPVPPLPPLPRTSGQAVDLANINNPTLLAARYDEAAARYDVTGIERQRLPTVGVSAGAGYSQYDGGSSGVSSFTTGAPPGTSFGFFSQNAAVQATIPLYKAGQVGSQIRQAQERRSELLATIGSVGRQVAESATNAVVSLQTSRALIQSSQVAVDANTLALEGVKQENQVGSRTVLEVLNAEQELLQTRANLVSARRDEYVAGYTLLAAIGQAEGDALAVPTDTYDPTTNARLVRHKWNDFDHNPNPPALPLPDPAIASRSVPIGPPQ